jgi:hypothetical protein
MNLAPSCWRLSSWTLWRQTFGSRYSTQREIQRSSSKGPPVSIGPGNSAGAAPDSLNETEEGMGLGGEKVREQMGDEQYYY